jgi:hypothetical protein
MRFFVLSALIALVSIFGSTSRAAVYSQMDPFTPFSPGRDIFSPNLSVVNNTRLSSFYDLGGNGFSAQVADRFTLPTGMLAGGLSWMGGYSNVGGVPPTTPAFRVGIYTGTPFSALTPVFENVVSVVQTAVSFPGFSNYYRYSVGLPSVNLNSGTTYWLSIAANLDPPYEWGWAFKNETTNPGVGDNFGAYREFVGYNGNVPLYETFNTNIDFAFRLEPIPEPSTMVIAISFVGTVLAGRRYRRRPKSAC